MKLKIKVKTFNGQESPRIIDKGDWIDLMSNEEYVADKEEYRLLKLGVAMKLPKGFEAVVAPRSSTFKHWGILLCNSLGIIDGKLI
jgi:dUTP pyrophosphatase